jgi:hypothetical protein
MPDVGDMIRIQATFIASGGAMSDPASVYMMLRNPKGSVATYGWSASVTRTGVGAFYVDVIASYPGGWAYRWQGQPSAGYAAAEGSFEAYSSFIL